MAKKFEYLESVPSVGKALFGALANDSKFLTDKGAEGWELVNAVITPKGFMKYYFKREVL